MSPQNVVECMLTSKNVWDAICDLAVVMIIERKDDEEVPTSP